MDKFLRPSIMDIDPDAADSSDMCSKTNYCFDEQISPHDLNNCSKGRGCYSNFDVPNALNNDILNNTIIHSEESFEFNVNDSILDNAQLSTYSDLDTGNLINQNDHDDVNKTFQKFNEQINIRTCRMALSENLNKSALPSFYLSTPKYKLKIEAGGHDKLLESEDLLKSNRLNKTINGPPRRRLNDFTAGKGISESLNTSEHQSFSSNRRIQLFEDNKDDRLSYWVTVFGFTDNHELDFILNDLKAIGSIDTYLTSHEGNWIHVKFYRKHDAQRALNMNGKQCWSSISKKLMMGVIPCSDSSLIDLGSNKLKSTFVKNDTSLSYRPTDKSLLNISSIYDTSKNDVADTSSRLNPDLSKSVRQSRMRSLGEYRRADSHEIRSPNDESTVGNAEESQSVFSRVFRFLFS
ncbi:hypothetical protein GJ496_006124 [Pomphorhynchus laevis]|nr:hypothetical protein GJ496_006124 [Pomphorhynchus laevis]